MRRPSGVTSQGPSARATATGGSPRGTNGKRRVREASMTEASVEQGAEAGQSAQPLAASVPAPRLPLSARLAFGVGPAAEGAQNVAFGTFVLFFYSNVLGLSGTAAGLALFLSLCVDAVMDPFVGSLSDNWHSRLGRRHPFMYASALPLALSLIALFSPPHGLAGGALFAWLLRFSIGVRVSLTLYQIPSGGMIPELTSDYDQRTGLASLRVFFGWLGAIAAAQLGYLVFFTGDGRLEAARYAGFGVACAALAGSAVL